MKNTVIKDAFIKEYLLNEEHDFYSEILWGKPLKKYAKISKKQTKEGVSVRWIPVSLVKREL